MIKTSVIIPCYNAASHIKDLFESLRNQTLPQNEFEVIVVDDGSQDKTASLVRKYPFIYLFQKNQGAGSARNFGVQKSQGQILLFTDSDCIVPRDWVGKHTLVQERNEKIGIIVGGVKKPKEKSLVAWADFFSSWFNAHENLDRHLVKDYSPSVNASLKKEIFKKVGGFSRKKLTGEDVDFCFRAQKLGVKILFDPSLSLWHKSPKFKGFLKHNYNWGYHAPFVRGKYSKMSYYFLFSGSFLKTLFLFFPIVLGYTMYLSFVWWRYQPVRFLICLPLVFLAKLSYGLGMLRGSWQKSFRKDDF